MRDNQTERAVQRAKTVWAGTKKRGSTTTRSSELLWQSAPVRVDLHVSTWGSFFRSQFVANLACRRSAYPDGAPSATLIETAKKRKSRSEFRCGFLFEEKGGARFRPSVRRRREAQNPSSVSRTKPSRPTTAGAACRRSTAP